MRKLLINLLCGFIPGRQRRKRIRARLTHPNVRQMIAFAKSFSDRQKPMVKFTYGFRCANLVVTVDDKWVFKFPLHGDAKDIAIREQRITNALRPISPIKIPDMNIIIWNNMYVRKYEFIAGIGFRALSREAQILHADTIAKQLGPCLHAIAQADPKEIADLKPRPTDKPTIMHGWNQNDLWDNFIMDPKTFKIVGLIDWEDAAFVDFYRCFTSGTGCSVAKQALLREYLNAAK